ncbi:MAG TPA: alpha/beta hydrolase [Rhizomicrobium sp.]|nr:alpha/beta hydrolase [Rhizomicrobium sp.]
MPLDIKRRLGATLLDLAVSRRGYRVERDLAYGAHPRNRLDLYIPEGLRAPAPMILFFYGGSWQSGEKGLYRAFGEAFTSKGIVVAVADYRLYPDARYPDFVEDSVEAFRFLRKSAGDYGGDPEKLFLAGHSAGAYNAMMLVCDPSYLRGDLSGVRGVIGISGPYDFLPLKDPALIEIFGGDKREETQPIKKVSTQYPPMLLITGAKDRTVSPRNTKRMAEKLRSFGTEVTEIFYPNIGHIEIILSVARFLRGRTSLREDIARFVLSR